MAAPTRNGLGIELMQYDPAGSGTTVGCDQEFCVANSLDGVPPRVPLDVVAVPVQDRLRRWELNHRLLRLRFRAVQPGVRQRPNHPVQRQHRVWVSGVVLSLVGILDPRAGPLMGFLGLARPPSRWPSPFSPTMCSNGTSVVTFR
jgi:hypothetical protein